MYLQYLTVKFRRDLCWKSWKITVFKVWAKSHPQHTLTWTLRGRWRHLTTGPNPLPLQCKELDLGSTSPFSPPGCVWELGTSRILCWTWMFDPFDSFDTLFAQICISLSVGFPKRMATFAPHCTRLQALHLQQPPSQCLTQKPHNPQVSPSTLLRTLHLFLFGGRSADASGSFSSSQLLRTLPGPSKCRWQSGNCP
jgi:hypothetical protein